MSRYLRSYGWADEPLDVDGLCDSGEMFVDGSVKNENNPSREERNRRREAIGRRYLLGHAPFIQSALLRGPFERKRGWISPWDNAHLHEDAERSKGISQIGGDEVQDSRAAIEVESETLLAEPEIEYGAETGDSDTGDDISMYTAQEDDENTSTQMYRANQGVELPQTVLTGAGQTSLYTSNKLLQIRPVDSMLTRPLSSTNSVGTGEDANPRQEKASLSLTAPRKRKAEKGWLRSTNLRKRSRHEILEFSSPTPAAGAGCRQCQKGSSEQPNYSPALQDPGYPISSNVDYPSRGDQATSQKATLQIIVKGQVGRDNNRGRGKNQNKSSRKDKARQASAEDGVATKLNLSDSRPGLPLKNRSKAVIIQGRVKSNSMHTSGQQHLDIVEPSASHVGIDDDAHLTMIGRLHHEANVEVETVMDDGVYLEEIGSFQDASKVTIGNTIAQNSEECTFTSPNAPSVGSEGSFQYRKTKCRSQKGPIVTERQMSPSIGKDNDVSSTIIRLQLAEEQRETSVVFKNGTKAKELNVSTDVNELYEKYKVSRDWGGSVDSASSVRDDVISVPSPDQLSGEFMSDFRLRAVSSDSDRTGQIFDEVSPSLKLVNNEQRVYVSRSILKPSQECKEASQARLPKQQDLVELTKGSRCHSPEAEIILTPELCSKVSQSPWMVVSSQNLLRTFAGRTGLQDMIGGGENGDLEVCVKDKNITGLGTPSIGTMADRDDQSERTLAPFHSTFKHFPKQQDEAKYPLDPIPGTQILVEAVTANPWSSAFKKLGKRRSVKRVSFRPLPLETKDEAGSSSPAAPIKPIKFPVPEAVVMISAHGDFKVADNAMADSVLADSVHFGVGQASSTKPQMKTFPSSPAIDAMAEAFINADRHNPDREITSMRSLGSVGLDSNSGNVMDTSADSGCWIGHEEHMSSSPIDASFSIAPSGKVTAVSIETSYFEDEDNLDAVIEDMGSFLEGWDVDSELKKVKTHLSDKGNDTKGQKKRRYLSGVSNR